MNLSVISFGALIMMIYYVTSSFVDMTCRNALEGSAVPVWAGSARNCCVISIQSMFMFQRSIVQCECDIKWLNLETGIPNLYQRSMSSSSMDDSSQRYQSAQLIPDRLITWTNRWVAPPSKSGLIGMLANHNLFLHDHGRFITKCMYVYVYYSCGTLKLPT